LVPELALSGADLAFVTGIIELGPLR